MALTDHRGQTVAVGYTVYCPHGPTRGPYSHVDEAMRVARQLAAEYDTIVQEYRDDESPGTIVWEG